MSVGNDVYIVAVSALCKIHFDVFTVQGSAQIFLNYGN